MKEPSIAHYYLYALLKRDVNGGMIISYKMIRFRMVLFLRFPCCYKLCFLKEMEQAGMITKINKSLYRLNNIECKRELHDLKGCDLTWR